MSNTDTACKSAARKAQTQLSSLRQMVDERIAKLRKDKIKSSDYVVFSGQRTLIAITEQNMCYEVTVEQKDHPDLGFTTETMSQLDLFQLILELARVYSYKQDNGQMDLLREEIGKLK